MNTSHCKPSRRTRACSTLSLEALEDRTVPSAPTGLKAHAVSTTEIDLSWVAAKGAKAYAVDAYINGGWELLGTATKTKFEATGLTPGTTYEFEVGAADGSITEFSKPVTATTVPPAPTAPVFTVQAIADNALLVQWSAVTGASQYRIEATAGRSRKIETVSGAFVSIALEGLKAGTTYEVSLTAINAGGSAEGTPLEAATYPARPSAKVKAESPGEVKVSWASVAGATSYEVDTLIGQVWHQSGSVPAGTTSFSVTGLTAGLSYEFEVIATDASGSTPSQVVSATTPTVAPKYSASTNWSGYAIVPASGTVTAVGGTWVVPDFSDFDTGYESTWVGIDGFGNDTVEQLGTAWDAQDGYSAWIEFYGDEDSFGDQGPFYYQFNIPLVVNPGDTISASIAFVSTNGSTSTFFMQMENVTTGQSLSSNETTTYIVPAMATGEWIAEAPGLANGSPSTLANFGAETFSGAWATVNGVTGAVNNFPGFAIDMTPGVSGGGGNAYTSDLINSPSLGYGETIGGSSTFTVFYGDPVLEFVNGRATQAVFRPGNVVAAANSGTVPFIQISDTLHWEFLTSPKHARMHPGDAGYDAAPPGGVYVD